MAEIKIGSATLTDEDLSALGTVRSLLGDFNGTTETQLGIDCRYTLYGEISEIHEAVKLRFEYALEVEELEALGGTEAAERGWNALRKRNPNHDASTGSREIRSFDDLPHKLKVTYAVFAQAVLNGGEEASEELADWEKELLAAVEPHQFNVGDRALVTGPAEWGGRSDLSAGPIEVGDVVEFRFEHGTYIDGEGDVYVYPEGGGDGQYIRHSSLEPITEPRTWERAEDVPDGVWFTQDGPDRGQWKRGEKAGTYDFMGIAGHTKFGSWEDRQSAGLCVNDFGPFVEVIA